MLALVVYRPGKLSIAYPPLFGSLFLFTLGIISIPDVLFVSNAVWNATLTLVAIIFLCLILDETHFFRYFAIAIARRSGGNPTRLFILIMLLSAVVTALFSNDGSILVMTPIVYSLLKETGVDRKQMIPFLMSVGFICDFTSLPFSISNLVNIISTNYFATSFLEYARVMILPDLAAITSSLLVLYLLFRKVLGNDLDIQKLPSPDSVIQDQFTFRVSVYLVAGLIVSYSIAGLFLFPISLIALPVVLVFFVFVKTRFKLKTGNMLRSTPWGVIFFALGMFLIVDAIATNGLASMLGNIVQDLNLLPGPLNYVAMAFLFSMLASVMNNLPGVITGNITLAAIHMPQLFYLNVLAADIGTKFTPVGSLATLLWMHFLREKWKIDISYSYFCKIGLIVTPPVLVVSVVVLWAVLLI